MGLVYEEADDADGEADGPEARLRQLWSIVPGALFQAVLLYDEAAGFNPYRWAASTT